MQNKPAHLKTILIGIMSLVILAAVPLTITTLQSRTSLEQQASYHDRDDDAVENVVKAQENVELNLQRVKDRNYYNLTNAERRKIIKRYRICRQNHSPKKCWRNVEKWLPPGIFEKFKITVTPEPTSVVPDEPTPTQEPVTNSTGTITLTIKACPQEIGTCNDAPGHQTGNMNPLHPNRTVVLSLYDSANKLAHTAPIPLTYDTATTRFTGTMILQGFTSGTYIAKLHMPGYLVSTIPGIQTLNASQTVELPPALLTPGDINKDNLVNNSDYQLLMNCFSDLQAKECPQSQIDATDLNDDGQINSIDYNVFIRILAEVRGG